MRPQILLLMILLATSGSARTASSAPAAARAQALFDEAERMLARHDIDGRRVAIDRLEQAVHLAPDVAEYWIALGNATLEGDFRTRARQCFESAARVAPAAWEPSYGLGRILARDWTSAIDSPSLEDAIVAFARSVELGPDRPEPLLRLAPLLYEAGDLRSALDAAARLSELAPDDARVALLEAYLLFRAGALAVSDSMFAQAIPRLPLAVRQRFQDVGPLLSESETGTLEELHGTDLETYRGRFWRETDPDPTTAENEAQLEYWARVAHASFVFQDPDVWDVRANLYVRFGSPAIAHYNPAGVPPVIDLNHHPVFWKGVIRIGEPHFYPTHTSLWSYPTLGMHVLLQDPSLSEHYRLPFSPEMSAEPVPSPAALASGEFVATGEGHAVFPTLPPGARRLPLAGHVARFETTAGLRLLAHVETAGTPGDTAWADCVVLDSLAREIARGGRRCSPSACRPERERTADFAFDLPPGDYRVVASVRDGNRGRGLFRTDAHVEDAGTELRISDVLVVCGPIEAEREARELRLLPNPRSLVEAGDPLVAYFEVYHLRPDRNGRSRFEYEYRVKPESAQDHRPWYRRMFGSSSPSAIVVRSRDEVLDTRRRQFAIVPVEGLPPGAYRLEIRVRDLESGTVRVGTAHFDHVEPPS